MQEQFSLFDRDERLSGILGEIRISAFTILHIFTCKCNSQQSVGSSYSYKSDRFVFNTGKRVVGRWIEVLEHMLTHLYV